MTSLFYSQPNALRPAVHGSTRLLPRDNFRFAGSTNAIPLAADEFAEVQAHYPIVFTRGGQPLPVAIVGLRDNENLFIDARGVWRADAYVPAYVRRYPFGLAQIQGSDQQVLAIDDTPAVVSSIEGEPLFDGDAPTETTRRALAFCSLFARQQQIAAGFAAALAEAGLLIERSAEWRTASLAEANRLSGFLVIDDAAFRALRPETVADWHARGWLALAYAHLMSMLRWRMLAMLATPAAQGRDAAATTEAPHPPN